MNYHIRTLNLSRDGIAIYGRLYLPEDVSASGLVILSHGFGATYQNNVYYAETLAKNGVAAYAYDFIGGGYRSQSGGKMTEMSVLTEAKDLEAVLDFFKAKTGIERNRIFLMGESQGGFVSTYVAGKRPDDVAGLVALYPAYVLQDDSRRNNPDPENGPDQRNIMGMTVGRIYDIDAQSFDIYNVMKDYHGKVLIIHGTADSIVPIAYSERAVKTFPDARLIKIKGAGHGFFGLAKKKAAQESVKFVRENNESL